MNASKEGGGKPASCPSCGAAAADRTECSGCGLIFAKWEQMRSRPAGAPAEPAGLSPVLSGIVILAVLAAVGLYAKSRLHFPANGDVGPAKPAGPPLDVAWPPTVGRTYPDLKLVDHTGKTVTLSSFKGKLILLEPTAVSCPACQAFSGAGSKGAFEGFSSQSDLISVEEALPKYAGISMDDPRLVFIQLLIYDRNVKPATPDDAARWARHFGFDKRPNVRVLAVDPRMVGSATYEMIPGFHLIDKDFIFRANSTKYQTSHDLWQGLLPLAGTLIGP